MDGTCDAFVSSVMKPVNRTTTVLPWGEIGRPRRKSEFHLLKSYDIVVCSLFSCITKSESVDRHWEKWT